MRIGVPARDSAAHVSACLNLRRRPVSETVKALASLVRRDP